MVRNSGETRNRVLLFHAEGGTLIGYDDAFA